MTDATGPAIRRRTHVSTPDTKVQHLWEGAMFEELKDMQGQQNDETARRIESRSELAPPEHLLLLDSTTSAGP